MSAQSLISHFLLPGYSNNQKAKILHSETIFLMVFFLLLSNYFRISYPISKINVLGFASQISTEEVIRLTNEKRSALGSDPLVVNDLLTKAAYAKGQDMLNRDYWAHVAPDGTQPWKFFQDVGYTYRYAGENLAKDFESPQATVNAWMASQTHKENLLSTKYNEIGVAVVEGDLNGVDTTIIVQLFGKRQNKNVASLTSSGAMVNNSKLETVVSTPTPTESIYREDSDQIDINQNISKSSVIKSLQDPSVNRVLISPFSINKYISAATVILLVVVFAIDFLYLTKNKVIRVGGKTFAHLMFLTTIVIVLFLIQSGDVLPPLIDSK